MKDKKLFKLLEPYIYLIPAFIFLALFIYFPFIKNIVLSFFSVNKYRDIKSFVFLKNYIKVLSDDNFLKAIYNTFIYVVITVPISLAIGLVLALLARKRTLTSSLYEGMYALPMAVSASVIAMIFQLIYNPSMGIINKILGINVSWLSDTRTAFLSIMFIQIWANVGYNFIFLLSGLRSMSEDVIEGAKIDGAKGMSMLTKIILPMISPTLLFLLVKDIAYAMTTCSFTLILAYPVFHSGGPNGSTETIMSYIYGKGIASSNYNLAFSATMIGFILSSILMALSFVVEKKKVSYN